MIIEENDIDLIGGTNGKYFICCATKRIHFDKSCIHIGEHKLERIHECLRIDISPIIIHSDGIFDFNEALVFRKKLANFELLDFGAKI